MAHAAGLDAVLSSGVSFNPPYLFNTFDIRGLDGKADFLQKLIDHTHVDFISLEEILARPHRSLHTTNDLIATHARTNRE